MPKSTHSTAQTKNGDGAFAALPFTMLLTSGVAFLVASSSGAPLLFTLLALLVGQAFALAATGVGERRSSGAEMPMSAAAEFGGVEDGALLEALRQAQEQVDVTEADRYVVVGAMGRLAVRQDPPSTAGAAFLLLRPDGGIVLGQVPGGELGAALRRHEEGALLAGTGEE